MTVSGQDGKDVIRVNYNRGGQTGLSGVTSTLELQGNNGSDEYVIGLAASNTAIFDIVDNASNDDGGVDSVEIYGNNDDNLFLFRATKDSADKKAFVASYEVDADLNPILGGYFERVNYNKDIEAISVNGRSGDDTFVFDDTSSIISVYGGAGEDTFQLGQVFSSARDDMNPTNGLDISDYFETTQTTRGFLSNGVSETANLYGGDGNDSFIVYSNKAEVFLFGEDGDDAFLIRSFVRVDPNDPKAPYTNINAGQGADFVSYNVNAPVRIDGGDGFDTLTVLGTEMGDDFVVNASGIFGGGLFITYGAIEKLVVDAAEGNDTFFVGGTSDGVEVEIVGGLGSDTFNVGGNDGEEITVVSNGLIGNSGLIEQSYNQINALYKDSFLEDLSVTVVDNDEAALVIAETKGR